MQAKVRTEGECVIVQLMGRLDVETAQPFRKVCLEQLTDKKVVFDFKELNFVGSSGILTFLETMQDFARTNQNGLKFCGVGSEFRKILAATSLAVIEIFDSATIAAAAFANAAMTQSAPAAGVVAVPVTTGVHARPQMPPMQPKAIMEGINPIFTVDSVEPGAGGESSTDADELDVLN